jgi:hypothetical protein
VCHEIDTKYNAHPPVESLQQKRPGSQQLLSLQHELPESQQAFPPHVCAVLGQHLEQPLEMQNKLIEIFSHSEPKHWLKRLSVSFDDWI